MKQTVSIDRFGRLVLPKSLRESLGIKAPGTVELTSGKSGVLVKPPPGPGGKLAKSRGRWVFSGALPPDWDSGKAVVEQRQHRTRTVPASR